MTIKNWIWGSACLLLGACGAAEDGLSEAASGEPQLGDFEDGSFGGDGVQDDGEASLELETLELGTLEQALGEAACGTNAVNRAVSFTGSAVRFGIPAPYGSATCANAFITGLSSATPRNARVSIIGQLNVPQANCPQARLRSDFYVNGAKVVAQLVSSGTFSNGNCVVSTSYDFKTSRTTNTISGTRANLAGGTPAAAVNARFVAQAVNNLGAIQAYTWEINKTD